MSKNSSAIKKTQISLKNHAKNKTYKSAVKTVTKKYFNSLNNVNNSNFNHVLCNLAYAYSKIDKAIKKGVIHKNNGSRKKSMLANAMKKALK
uniref:Ribosomal protein S20 n=1 Tax=Dicranema revolutum TaxID=239144 RepID=A0A4D6WSA0_9FLOR|nr:ribosomal protein S20 [Dicranema revolutum]